MAAAYVTALLLGASLISTSKGYAVNERPLFTPIPPPQPNGLHHHQSVGSAPTPHCSEQAKLLLIQNQSLGRIVNHKNHVNSEQSLEPAASNNLPQLVRGPGVPPPNLVPPPHQLPQPQPVIVGNQYAQSNQNSLGYTYNAIKNVQPPQHHTHHHHYTVPATVGNYQAGVQAGAQAGVQTAQFVPPQTYQTLPTQLFNEQSFKAGSTSSSSYQLTGGNNIANFGQLMQNSHAALNGQLGQVIKETFASASLDPAAEKHIYVHIPPDDLEKDYKAAQQIQNLPQLPPRKHYKIIFIKAPSTPTQNYAQQLAAVPQTEEKTLVYVLVKKPDEPSLEEIQSIQQSTYKENKPEVYFIKYKTRTENEGASQQHRQQHQGDVITPTLNEFSSDGSDAIDIRLGAGESGSAGNADSYSTLPSTSTSTSFNSHTSYGVPLN